MTWRVSITTKMLSIVGLTFVAIAVIVGVSLVAFSRFTLAVQHIYEHGVVDMSVVSNIALDVEVQRGLAGRAPSELNLESQGKYQADFMARSAAIDQNLASLRKVGRDPEQTRLLSEMQAASAAFRAEAEHVFTFAGRFAQDEAVKVLQGRFAAADAQVRHVLDQLVMNTNLSPQPLVVVNKSGDAGAERFLYVRDKKGDPHVIIITLCNLFTTPLLTSAPFNWKDFTVLARFSPG
jgi:Four helix bundle sensory module for signal transduction